LHHSPRLAPAADDEQLNRPEFWKPLAAHFDEERVEIHVHQAGRHAGKLAGRTSSI
jgi:hypothetical protein